jgi:hypothetical protein
MHVTDNACGSNALEGFVCGVLFFGDFHFEPANGDCKQRSIMTRKDMIASASNKNTRICLGNARACIDSQMQVKNLQAIETLVVVTRGRWSRCDRGCPCHHGIFDICQCSMLSLR